MRCVYLISWKDSFEKINNELDLTRKKQNALEELHSNDRISHLTYENLNKALTTEIEQIEARRKELAEKMTSKLNDLEKQISNLETFLANVEMSYAAGEITEELHNQEVNALNLGLEATKNELDFIKEAIMQLVPEETQAELTTTIETTETVEATPTETDMETLPEVSVTEPIETPPVTDETSIEQPAEMLTETSETPEMLETPIETPTEEITEEMTEEKIEETIPEEQIAEETIETLTEEIMSEEQVVPETPTEEMLTEEQLLSETPAEEATEEILPEEEIVSETPMDGSQPFPEENPEE
jgi:hypothetical protein